ncbi:MoaD/ThiS family protein [Ochrovirga pacifica]|uniref:MoaD/ThiS family protein n=1 Tax=Ochrovirga pacifica TaxID=1042376 RepID=UPI0002559B24|nr:MoaD/ThiS family protein [Ochrovirga pacifica]
MKITVKYFGMLLEQTQSETEVLHCTEGSTIASVEKIVLEKYPSLQNFSYNIAHNRTLKKKQQSVTDGDELAFLPPFAGG